MMRSYRVKFRLPRALNLHLPTQTSIESRHLQLLSTPCAYLADGLCSLILPIQFIHLCSARPFAKLAKPEQSTSEQGTSIVLSLPAFDKLAWQACGRCCRRTAISLQSVIRLQPWHQVNQVLKPCAFSHAYRASLSRDMPCSFK